MHAAPRTAKIENGKATFDAHDLSTRQINLELRRLLRGGITDVTVQNPGAKHSIGVGILTRCRITFDGCSATSARPHRRPRDQINGRVGWSACENMMSGVVVVEGNAGSLTGRPSAGATSSRARSARAPHRPEGRHDHRPRRRRLDDRLHDAARPPDPLRQRRPGPRRLDVRRDDLRRRQGQVARDRLRPGRVDRRRHRVHRAQVQDLRADPPELQKFVCGKVLYNYDNLEPAERKLVL